MSKDNLVLYMIMFYDCFPFVPLAPHSLLDFLIIIIYFLF